MPSTGMLRVQTVVTGVAGSPYYLTGYFDADGAIPDSVIDRWHDFVIGDEAFPLAGTITRTDGELPIVNPQTGQIVGQVTGTGRTTVGTRNYDLAPLQTQLLVRWRTGEYIGGREIRGRTSIPLVGEASVSANGNVSQETIGSINLQAANLLSGIGGDFVVWSKKNGVWYAATSASCWEKFSVLRSRRD